MEIQLNRVQVINQEFKHLQIYITKIHEVDGDKFTKDEIITVMCGDFEKVLELSEAIHAACEVMWTDDRIESYQATLEPENESVE